MCQKPNTLPCELQEAAVDGTVLVSIMQWCHSKTTVWFIDCWCFTVSDGQRASTMTFQPPPSAWQRAIPTVHCISWLGTDCLTYASYVWLRRGTFLSFFVFFFKLDQIFAHSIHIQKLKREAVEICRDEQTKPTLVQGQRGQIQQVCQCVVVVVVQGVTFDAWYKNMITVWRSSDQMQWHWLHSVFQQEGQPHPVPVRWTVPLVQGSPPGAKDRSSQDVPQIPLLPLHRQQGFRSELVRHGPGCAQGLWRADAGRHVQWLRWA